MIRQIFFIIFRATPFLTLRFLRVLLDEGIVHLLPGTIRILVMYLVQIDFRGNGMVLFSKNFLFADLFSVSSFLFILHSPLHLFFSGLQHRSVRSSFTGFIIANICSYFYSKSGGFPDDFGRFPYIPGRSPSSPAGPDHPTISSNVVPSILLILRRRWISIGVVPFSILDNVLSEMPSSSAKQIWLIPFPLRNLRSFRQSHSVLFLLSYFPFFHLLCFHGFKTV